MNEHESEQNTTPVNENESFNDSVVFEEPDAMADFDEEVDTGSDGAAPKMPVKSQLIVLSVFLVGVFSIGAAPQLLATLGEKDNVGAVSGSVAQGEEKENEENTDPYADLNLQAKAALVYDARDGEVLYEQEPTKVWPLASVTKLMTVLLASELVEPNEAVTITAEAVAQDGDSGLSAGEVFSFADLSDLTIVTSSNDGAYAMAHAAGLKLDRNDPAAAFVKAMNIRAEEIGLTDTYFRNPTGLDLQEDESGAYGTAQDMALLLTYILENRPEVLEKTTELKDVIYNSAGLSHRVSNTNTVVNAIPGLIGSKTGYTTLSGGNLAIAFDAGVGHPVVVVVLGSSHQGRLSDVLQLVEAARAQLKTD